jgi:hypothetical protein
VLAARTTAFATAASESGGDGRQAWRIVIFSRVFNGCLRRQALAVREGTTPELARTWQHIETLIGHDPIAAPATPAIDQRTN